MVCNWTHSVVDLQQRLSLTEERVRLAEARIAGTADTVSKMDPAALSGAGSHRQRLVDGKNLLPDSFSGAKGMQWRDWNHRTKCYMAAMKMIVRQAVDSVERRVEPVLYEQLQSFGMTPEDDTELKAFLALKTTDQAHTIVRQHDLDPGLEQYRALAAYFEPDTEARGLADDPPAADREQHGRLRQAIPGVERGVPAPCKPVRPHPDSRRRRPAHDLDRHAAAQRARGCEPEPAFVDHR